MATGVELATAWVRLTPSMEGVQGEVAKSLGGVEEDFDKAGKGAGGRFGKAAGAAALAAGAAIAAGLVTVFNTGLEEIKFGEQLNAQTDVLVKNTGFAMSTDAIGDYTLALSQVSGISEEDLQGAGNELLKFGDLNEDTYKRAVDSINDMGAAGKDVGAVGTALGKALADPAAAAGLLKKQGVLLNEEQQKMIDGFIEAGDKAGAQGVILDALNGTYDGMAEKTGETMTGQLNKLNNSFENVSGELVTALMPAIMLVVEGLSGFAAWVSENQPIFFIIVGVLALLALAFVGVTIATWAMNTALLANPITWIILAIIALIAIIIVLVMNWDAVVAWLTEVWNGFVTWFVAVMDGFFAWWNGVWAGFASWIGEVWTGFTTWIGEIWNGFVAWLVGVIDGFFGWWNGIWTAVGQFISDVWNGFIGMVSDAWNAISAWVIGAIVAYYSWWMGIWTGIGNFLGDVWNGLIGFVSGAWANIWGFISGAVDGFFGWWNGIWGTVGDVIRDVFGGVAGFLEDTWNGIVGTIRGAVNGIIGLVNGAIRGLNGMSVDIPDWVPGVGGQSFGLNIPTIPLLATGGTITRSGHVIVGEQGPELLKLPRGAQVNPDYDEVADGGGDFTFINYAPLGSTPSQELETFANRRKVFA